MASPPSPSHALLFAAVSLSLFLYSPSPTKAAAAPPPSSPDLVENVCNTTQVYDHEFCMKVLGSDPRTASAPDILAIAKIALDLAVTNASNVRNYIDGRLKSNDVNSDALKTALEKCASCYEAVYFSFRSSLAELDYDAMTANYDAKVAGDDVLDCENEMSSRGVSDPSMSAKSEVMMHFVRIGDAVTTLLWP